ncbi:MAG: FAD-binding protein [Desulfuromonadaceae bacterium]|nr:FAD-binding protein [Desulfuromonadaceae bacterium]
MINLNLLNKLDNFKYYLDSEDIWYRPNYLLKYDTYFQMGGYVYVYVCPQNLITLKLVISYLIENKIEYKIIGGTSNIVFLDKINYSVVISTKNLKTIRVADSSVYVDCGYSLQDFVRVAVTHGSEGFEGLEGIPGTIGGALFMNAGAYGYTISDNLISVDCLNINGDYFVLEKKDGLFSYRTSIFKNEKIIILSACFNFKSGNKKEIEKKIEKFHIARHSYQEFVYPNLGSMFSCKGDFYYNLITHDKINIIKFYFLKLIFKNSIAKFINRKKPNNSIFNWFVSKHIKINNYKPSNKSMNIMINNGSDISTIIDYAILLRNRLNNKIYLENEFIVEPNIFIDKELLSVIEKIKLLHNIGGN